MPPAPDPPFDSTIELFDAANKLVATGSFPGGTSVGTLPIPLGTPPGAYNVEVSCSQSLGNGTFFPTNPLTIGSPALIDLPPDFTPPGGGSSGGGAGSGASTPASTNVQRQCRRRPR